MIQVVELYYGRITYEKKLLWIGPKIRHEVTRRDFDSPATAIPYGTFGGGYFEFNPFVRAGDGTFTQKFIVDLPGFIPGLSVPHRQVGFIPVASALDIVKDSGGNLTVQDYRTPYSGGMTGAPDLISNFDAFIVDNEPDFRDNNPNAPRDRTVPGNYFNENNKHLTFQPRSGNWLANELNEQPALNQLEDCSLACEMSSWQITGPDEFCDRATFSVPPGAGSYSWNYPGVITTPDPSQPNIVEVQEWNNGHHTLSVTFPGMEECDLDGFRVSKRVWAGEPEIEGTGLQEITGQNYIALGLYPQGNYCGEQAFQLVNVPYTEQVKGIEWRKVRGESYWDGPARNGSMMREVVFYPACNELFEFEVRYQNDCGYTDWERFSVNLDVCQDSCLPPPPSGISSPNFNIFPVPTDGMLTIAKKTSTQWNFFGLCEPNPIDPTVPDHCYYYVRVRLFDFTGNEVYNQEHLINAEVDLTYLPSGTYVMHLSNGWNTEIHQLPIL